MPLAKAFRVERDTNLCAPAFSTLFFIEPMARDDSGGVADVVDGGWWGLGEVIWMDKLPGRVIASGGLITPFMPICEDTVTAGEAARAAAGDASPQLPSSI